jgi:hypothetical protein
MVEGHKISPNRRNNKKKPSTENTNSPHEGNINSPAEGLDQYLPLSSAQDAPNVSMNPNIPGGTAQKVEKYNPEEFKKNLKCLVSIANLFHSLNPKAR